MSNFKYEIKNDKCYLIFGDYRMRIPWFKRWIPESADVTVYPTKIELSKTTLSFTLGVTEPEQLTATLVPEGSAGSVTWKSSKSTVATVSNAGLVTAVGKGTCTITCTSTIDNTIKATCSVTVEESQNPTPDPTPAE